jgi:hypothetical protein
MMSRGARRARAGAVVALAAGAAAVSCVLADPPADLPVSPIQAPQIIRDGVQPPITAFLDTLPNDIFAPVTVDPREPDLDWQWSVDGVSTLTPGSGKISAATFNIEFPPSTPTSNECHLLELDVFYRDSTLAHDTVTWFYSPSRSFAGCPVYDAGPPDAGEDAAPETGSGSDD